MLVKMVGVTLIKISICLFLLRLCPFTDRIGRVLIWSTLLVTVATWFGSFFHTLFWCHPVQAAWDLRIRLFGTYSCVAIGEELLAWVAVYAVLDLWLLLLPLRFLYRLQAPIRKKIGVAVIFMLGGIATAIGFLKLSAIEDAYNSWDPSCRCLIYELG